MASAGGYELKVNICKASLLQNHQSLYPLQPNPSYLLLLHNGIITGSEKVHEVNALLPTEETSALEVFAIEKCSCL